MTIRKLKRIIVAFTFLSVSVMLSYSKDNETADVEYPKIELT